jgi:hypothetical protein
MNLSEKQKYLLNLFFENNYSQYKQTCFHLLNTFSELVSFDIKIQKASIQLINPEPFAVLAFRKSITGIIIEFYNNGEIKSDRIIKTIKNVGKPTIRRMTIQNIEEIDEELMKWFANSYRIMKICKLR